MELKNTKRKEKLTLRKSSKNKDIHPCVGFKMKQLLLLSWASIYFLTKPKTRWKSLYMALSQSRKPPMLRKYPDAHQDKTSGPLTNILIGESNVKVLLMPCFRSIRCYRKNYYARLVFDYCFKI